MILKYEAKTENASFYKHRKHATACSNKKWKNQVLEKETTSERKQPFLNLSEQQTNYCFTVFASVTSRPSFGFLSSNSQIRFPLKAFIRCVFEMHYNLI